MPAPGRSLPAAAAVNDKVYVVGGYDGTNYLQDCDEYDPSTNTWTSKADMPAPGRCWLAAAAVDTKVYVMGGSDGTADYPDCDALETVRYGTIEEV